MKRLMTVTTLMILITLLGVGLYAPMSPIMLLAATTEDYVIIRSGLILVLISLLLYQPPRATAFRVALVAVAASLAATGLWQVYTYQIELFDALMLLEISILLFIEAAEINVKKKAEDQMEPTASRRLKRIKLQTA